MLSFYYLFPMYRTFLRELGVPFVESEAPAARALDGLSLSPTDEPCPSVKTAFYHCRMLLDRGCDVLFVPALVSLGRTNYCCPKMMGLPDMIKAGLDLRPEQLISPVIDVKENSNWEKSWVEAAYALGVKDRKVALRAVKGGWAAWADARDSMARHQIPVPRMMEGSSDEASEKSSGCNRPVTGLMGHAYVLYDVFGAGVLDLVSSFGKAITPEMVPEEAALAEVRTIFEGEKLWAFEAHILGASFYLLRNRLVDGIVFVSSFSCGPASIIEDYIEDEADRQGIPFLGLVVDEHAGHLGLLTRIETFMDATTGAGTRRAVAPQSRPGQQPEAPGIPSPQSRGVSSPGRGKAEPFADGEVSGRDGNSEDGSRRDGREQDGSGPLQRDADGREKPPGAGSPGTLARGPEVRSRPGVLTMGNLYIPLKALFHECGADVLTPPELSDRLVALGRELAPEFICYPMVALLGQCRELCRAGANRIAMVMGKGRCRLGWYAQVMESLLRRAGYDVEVVGFDSPFPWTERGSAFLRQAQKIVGKPAARAVFGGASVALTKLLLLEQAEEMLRELRAYEVPRGAGDRLYMGFLRDLDAASSIGACTRAFGRFRRECAEVPKTGEPAVTVSIVGEIYVLNEPFVNKDIERVLGSLQERVRVKRDLTVMNWLKRHIMAVPSSILHEMRVKRAAAPYLRLSVGGHGLESVGESVLAARSRMDGVIHLLPFTCMPEIVAQSILVKVTEDLDIPILSLVLSEQTGAVGLKTRLEAFADLLWGRKRSRSKRAERYSVSLRPQLPGRMGE
ncbi:MAG: hypothetical protein IMW97_04895 [Firmicutes bacterium]|nr:hypothetical protein [Candidatus Fermentithermobacillaceae bacterium]